MNRPPFAGVVVAVLVGLGPLTVTAQVAWDPRAYTTLIETGRVQHEQAWDEPEGSSARRDLFVSSLSANRQAQNMLREAILNGAVDAFRDDAVAELFNLTDNIIVALMALDQCEAAAAETERLADDVVLHPPDAGRHIDLLRVSVSACRQRVATAPPPWNEADYREAEQQAESWRRRASTAATSTERQAALYVATVAESDALRMLRDAALGGVAVPGIEPVERLSVHYNRVAIGLFEMGLCEAAENRLFERDETLDELGATDARPDYDGELAECRAARVETEIESSDEPVTLPPPVQVVERDTNPWPWLLIGAGVSAGLAALFVDIAAAGDRDEFERLEDECNSGSACNVEALETLGDSLDRRKILVGVLAGVAIVSAASGLIWVLTADDDEESTDHATLELVPMAGPSTIGAGVRLVH